MPASPNPAMPTPAQTPDVYPKGRRCSDCATTLSIYNPGPWCHCCERARIDDELAGELAEPDEQLLRAA